MYHIIETQQNADGTVGVLTYQEDTQQKAESRFYSIMSAAAVSNVYIHSAIVLAEDLSVITRKSYKHKIQDGDE